MKKIIFASVAIGILFGGCSSRLGNMTAVSTHNINGLQAKVEPKQHVKGESCRYTALIIPFGDFQNRLQIATDNAIANGHKAGVNGDTLINVKIDVSDFAIPLVYGKNCMVVEGDLVALAKSVQK